MITIDYEFPDHATDMQYIKDNCSKIRGHSGFWKVENELHVFKQAQAHSFQADFSIVNLVIPKGATIYIQPETKMRYDSDPCHCRKMRASEAFVHSVYDCLVGGYVNYPENRVVFKSVQKTKLVGSNWEYSFKYETGKIVKPKNGFSWQKERCESGIHFFINLCDAINY